MAPSIRLTRGLRLARSAEAEAPQRLPRRSKPLPCPFALSDLGMVSPPPSLSWAVISGSEGCFVFRWR